MRSTYINDATQQASEWYARTTNDAKNVARMTRKFIQQTENIMKEAEPVSTSPIMGVPPAASAWIVKGASQPSSIDEGGSSDSHQLEGKQNCVASVESCAASLLRGEAPRSRPPASQLRVAEGGGGLRPGGPEPGEQPGRQAPMALVREESCEELRHAEHGKLCAVCFNVYRALGHSARSNILTHTVLNLMLS